ncbi:LysR family transcriptional regulator [Mycolicibacterium rhodesiae]|uniref:LysR family transcriptional regulator n=1 Tax=Mycolicibacterium rhodesiae TaxID=36814 RepID=A0A1X0IK07_MYCRH|nr:LysR family transcriptional regulator [Mycolicibacterium rhodesiae]MCV7346367.1 LysR family transcriptional regulator [Mycolicibacterium rhodesiae]ORB48140.1 LysR family transcriptional regulator [Mycolicibacterium rhodesiae]
MDLDLNLLLALDALLELRSVGLAAERLHTSAPAMSRTLGRLRRRLDDPVLVRAGRQMVPTPRALAMQAEVHDVIARARALFATPETVEPRRLSRTFSLQMGDIGMLSTVAERLLARVRTEAPGVTLRFVGESHEDTHSLRDGGVDLEVGQTSHLDPEIRVEELITDRMVGVARAGHPLLKQRVTVKRFADAEHVVFSRRGRLRGPVDDLLAEHGLQRRVVVCAPTPAGGLFLVRSSDLVAMMAAGLGRYAMEALNLKSFAIPLDLPPLTISMAWHPRHDADGAHRWLRQCVREAL